MHRLTPPPSVPAFAPSSLAAGKRGFSLVEISLALGIIGFAFIALLGLLPVGLQTFRSAIDTGNEARIVQSFFSMLIATDFANIDELDFATSSEIYYFDEEGMPTDTSQDQVSALASQRLYAAKLFIEEPEIPVDTKLTYGVKALVIFANIATPALAEFEKINSLGELRSLLTEKKGSTEVRIRPILVAKMDGFQQ
jgi:uncharacterized protein (TIGR02598 family)